MRRASKRPVAELKQQAEQGDVEAQLHLAAAYYSGNGVPQNKAEGAKWLLKAAEQGYALAQCDLGVMYQKGEGVEQSYKDALKWYRRAAEQGDVLAQHNLGSLNAKGFNLKGLGFFNATRFAYMKATQNFVEAYFWFSLASAKGHRLSAWDKTVIKRRMSAQQIAEAKKLIAEHMKKK